MSALVLNLPLGARVESRDLETRVRIDEAASGKELRSSWWGSPRYRYRIVSDVLRSDSGSRADAQQWWSMFARHFGELDSFLWQDPDDYTVASHGFGVGDGATTVFQLQRSMVGSVYDQLGGPWPVSTVPRTNLISFGEAFDNAAWGKTSCSISANSVLAPSGPITGDAMVEAAATANHYAEQAFTAVASSVASLSVFVKPWDRTWFFLGMVLRDGVTVQGQWFNLSAGTKGTSTLGAGGSASISAAPGAWWRLSITNNVGTGGSSPVMRCQMTTGDNVGSYAGDGASKLYVWGAVAELAAAPTQYFTGTSTPAYYPAYTDGFEPVWEPIAGSVGVSKAGVVQTPFTDYTPGSNGAITFAVAPASAAALTWSGSYYRRVRLDGPPSFRRIGQGYWQAECSLVSVKP